MISTLWGRRWMAVLLAAVLILSQFAMVVQVRADEVNGPPPGGGVGPPSPSGSTIELTGIVSDENGNPLQGAHVRAGLSSDFEGVAVTDSDGRYSMDIAPGVYDLYVGYDYSSARMVDVSVLEGPVVTQDVTVTTPVGIISGVITDKNNNVLMPHIRVTNEDGNSVDVAVFHHDGKYTIHIPTGTYTLDVYAGGDVFTTPNVVVTNGQTTILNYEQLSLTSISGVVYDANLEVVSGAGILVQTSNGAEYRTTTSMDGEYTAPASAGTYSVTAFQGYYIGESGSVVVSMGEVTSDVNITLSTLVGKVVVTAESAFEMSENTLWLELLDFHNKSVKTIIEPKSAGTYELYVPGGSYTLSGYAHGQSFYEDLDIVDGETVAEHFTLISSNIMGIVTDGNTMVFPNVEVRIEASDGNSWSAFTNSNGTFTSYVPVGVYKVKAANGYLYGESATVQAGEGQVVFTDIKLQTSVGIITGKMTAVGSDDPLDYWIRVFDNEGTRLDVDTQFDDKGFYILRLPAGTYTLRVDVGEVSEFPDVVVTNGSTTTLNMSLAITAISGFVRDVDGNGVPGAEIRAYGDKSHSYSGFTQSDGSFSLNVEAGTYNLVSYEGYYSGKSGSISIDKGENRVVDIILSTHNGIIKSKITNEGSDDPLHLPVYVSYSDGMWVDTMGHYDDDGFFNMLVPAGTYTLKVYDGSNFEQPNVTLTNFVVTNGVTRIQNFELSVKSLTVLVVDSDGNPVENAAVKVSGMGTGQPYTGTTNVDGTYTFELGWGMYDISALSGYWRGSKLGELVISNHVTVQLEEQFGIITGGVTNQLGLVSYPHLTLQNSSDEYVNVYPDYSDNGKQYTYQVADGSYKLSVKVLGQDIGTRDVLVTNGQTIIEDFDILITQLTGVVRDENNDPVVNAGVLVRGSHFSANVMTDYMGRYKADLLSGGIYNVSAGKGYMIGSNQDVVIEDNEIVLSDVQLTRPAGIFQYLIYDQDGFPVNNVFSYLMNSDVQMAGIRDLTIDNQPYSLIAEAGTYTFNIHMNDVSYELPNVIITNGTTTTKDIYLDGAGSIVTPSFTITGSSNLKEGYTSAAFDVTGILTHFDSNPEGGVSLVTITDGESDPITLESSAFIAASPTTATVTIPTGLIAKWGIPRTAQTYTLTIDSASTTFTVVPIQSISIEAEAHDLLVGDTMQLTVNGIFADESESTLENSEILWTWNKENGQIVNIDEQGVLTAVGTGTVVLVAIQLTTGLTETYQITVREPVTLTMDAELYLGSTSSFNDLLRARLDDDAVDRRVESLTVTLKTTGKDDIVFTSEDLIWLDQSGHLAALDIHNRLIAKLSIPNVDPLTTSIEISGPGIRQSSGINLDLETDTSPDTMILYHGDVDGLPSVTGDYDAWLDIYIKYRMGTATPDELVRADITLDGKVNNLDFSMWLAMKTMLDMVN